MSVRPGLYRPLANRVDPFGRIVAHPAYGMLMGNRGCLHDDNGRIVRRHERAAWISCLPRWPGVNRPLMAPNAYTELFFLDEATAMAAGHRPCGSCRPDQLRAFKQAWRRAFQLHHAPLVAEMDQALRAAPGVGVIEALDTLSDGAMIAVAGQPLLRWGGRWLPWTFGGYGAPIVPNASWAPALVTPTPMIAVLRAGYRPLAHPSALQPSG